MSAEVFRSGVNSGSHAKLSSKRQELLERRNSLRISVAGLAATRPVVVEVGAPRVPERQVQPGDLDFHVEGASAVNMHAVVQWLQGKQENLCSLLLAHWQCVVRLLRCQRELCLVLCADGAREEASVCR